MLPVGNAGNITAYWRGYTQYASAGRATRTPRMWGFQAAGAAPLVLGHPVLDPETVATAIRIGNPASADQAIAARDESGGLIDAVTDEQILAAQSFLAAREGIFVEPASAAGVAGLLAKRRTRRARAPASRSSSRSPGTGSRTSTPRSPGADRSGPRWSRPT